MPTTTQTFPAILYTILLLNAIKKGKLSVEDVDRAVERISSKYLATHYVTALTNIFRRKGRLILTELVLVIAGVMYLMVMSLSSSINTTLDAEFGRRTHDIIVTFTDPQRIERATAVAETMAGVSKADMWVVYPVTILRNGKRSKDAGLGSQLQGVPLPDAMFTPMVVEGRWLEAGDNRAIVMAKKTADDEGIKLGDTLILDLGTLGKSDWQVVGLYRTYLMSGGGFSIDAIYATRPAVLEAAKQVGRADTLLVRTSDHSPAATQTLANAIETRFKDLNMKVMQTETMANTRKTADTSFAITVDMLLVLALIIAVVGAIGLAGALSISVIERTKEIGVLRSIGARSRIILRMFLLEGIVQGLLSWLIAVPLSLLLAPLLANVMGQALFSAKLVFGYNFAAVLVWLGVILVFSTLASILPARSATQVNVRQSLSYE